MGQNKWTEIAARILSSRHLWTVLNRKILDVALLRLRFCSISPAKSGINPGAITWNVIYEQALNFDRKPEPGWGFPGINSTAFEQKES
jgi:hypothetical protein